MWQFHLRRLHDSALLSCELSVLRQGERPGWDDHYVMTYWTEAEARAAGEKLLAAPYGTPVDVGYGVTITLPK